MRPNWRRSSYALLALLPGLLSSPCIVGAQSITSWPPEEPVTVKLADGRRFEGRYRGTLGSATDAPYAARYAAWLDEVGPTSAPALGESLLVARASGEPLRGVFAGFAGGDLLLATVDSCSFLVVPLDGNNVRRTDEPAMDSDWIAARELWKAAPVPYSLIVQTDEASLAVPAAAVTFRGGFAHGGGGAGGGGVSGGAVAAGVILGVVVGALVAYAVVGAAIASAFSHMLI